MKYVIIVLMCVCTHAIETPDYPGPGKVGTCLHKYIPTDLSFIIRGVTQTNVDHTFYTVTKNGVKGVFHSDGIGGARFMPWFDFCQLVMTDSIQIYKPKPKEIGLTELKGTCLPEPFRSHLAQLIGYVRLYQWQSELLKFEGVAYDFFFLPFDNEVYCSEVGAHAWDKIGTFSMFRPIPAGNTLGWNVEAYPDITFGMIFISQGLTPDVPVYPPAQVATNKYFVIE
jgi:hypothetical protein